MKGAVSSIFLLSLCRHTLADSASSSASSDDFARGGDIVPYTLPWWHPEIQHVSVNRIPGPSDHPELDNDPEFQAFIRANTGEGHRFLDGRRGFIQRPWGLPRGHPNCDDYFVYQEIPVNDLPTVHFDHPDIHKAYLDGERLPQSHPSVSGLLQKVLPPGHPDPDDLFVDHDELPDWHPDLSLLLVDNPIDPIYIFSGHPDIEDELGEAVDDHPSIHYLFEAHLPSGHRDIDDILKEGYELPSWHPSISQIVVPRSFFASPGMLLVYIIAALVTIIMLAQKITQWRNSKRTMNMTITKRHSVETSSSSSEESIECSFKEEPDEGEGGGMSIMMRRNQEFDNNLNENEDRILVYKEKKSNWKGVFGKRAVKSSHSISEVIFCILYFIINLAVVLISPTYALDVGFGSVSSANNFFTFLTATRNGVFSWLLGLAFDQALIYHRFIGRLTVASALAHSCFYIKDVFEKPLDGVIITGLASLGFGFVIVLSSLNWVRRKHFNVFIWSHVISFVGFLVGLFLHASAARPFILAAAVCYCIDKGIQMMRKMPRKTKLFQKVDDRTVHVKVAKTRFSSVFATHQVGQYMFVNFPALSLKEWHPFSIASSPNDADIDIYIRALGDHTKKIVEYANENEQVKICCDGPYGSLPFNYRRYGSIVFVAGGIGITPIIGILKDIYDNASSTKNKPSHCIKCISVVWVMPHASEASLFLDLLNSFHLKALQDPLLPELQLSIHVTRDSADSMIIGQHVVYSKPQFGIVMDDFVGNNIEPEHISSLLVYACGPSRLVKQLWDASMKKQSKKLRVDFYHEKFEF